MCPPGAKTTRERAISQKDVVMKRLEGDRGDCKSEGLQSLGKAGATLKVPPIVYCSRRSDETEGRTMDAQLVLSKAPL